MKNEAYLLWSKNSIERLMISSSVMILLSSSATSPRSSFDPLEAAEKHTEVNECIFFSNFAQAECKFTPSVSPKMSLSHCHCGDQLEFMLSVTHRLRGARHKSLSSSSFHLRMFRKQRRYKFQFTHENHFEAENTPEPALFCLCNHNRLH